MLLLRFECSSLLINIFLLCRLDTYLHPLMLCECSYLVIKCSPFVSTIFPLKIWFFLSTYFHVSFINFFYLNNENFLFIAIAIVSINFRKVPSSNREVPSIIMLTSICSFECFLNNTSVVFTSKYTYLFLRFYWPLLIKWSTYICPF